ncbi:hypothetical protein D3C77_729740 [compost metagenome]
MIWICADNDCSLTITRLHCIFDGILNYRLQGQLQDTDVQILGVHIYFAFEVLGVPDMNNIQIFR